MNTSLSFNGKTYAVENAELSLRVETETWDAATNSWVYGRKPTLVLALELWVDSGAGEAAGLAPNVYFHLPTTISADLSGLRLDEAEHTVEAWWDNDAPALESNRLELRSALTCEPLELRWSATAASGAELIFEGTVTFVGLSLKVQRPTDVEGFLSRVWPALSQQQLKLASESEIDFGEDQEERRHWLELHYDLVSPPPN